MEKQFKIGIIGCGCISETHIAAILKDNLGEIVAVCDTNSEKLEKTKKLLPNALCFSDYHELLKLSEIDIIHICTPHYLHAEMSIAAMKANKSVYLEKPAAMNYKQALSIKECSAKTGKKVCVSFQNRLANANHALLSLVNSGEYGKILGLKGIVAWCRKGDYYTKSGWRGTWEREGGGVLMNQSIHTLDMLCLLGGEIEKTEGTATLHKNKGTIEVEDTAEAILYFKSGASAFFYATNCNVIDSPVEIEVICEKAHFAIRDDVLYMKQNGVFEAVARNDSLETGKTVWGDGHRRMIANFYSALRGADAYYCDINEGIKALSVIDDIYKGFPLITR